MQYHFCEINLLITRKLAALIWWFRSGLKSRILHRFLNSLWRASGKRTLNFGPLRILCYWLEFTCTGEIPSLLIVSLSLLGGAQHFGVSMFCHRWWVFVFERGWWVYLANWGNDASSYGRWVCRASHWCWKNYLEVFVAMSLCRVSCKF